MNIKVFKVYLNTKNKNSFSIRTEIIWKVIFIKYSQLTFQNFFQYE